MKKVFASTLLTAIVLGLFGMPFAAAAAGCRCGTALSGGICGSVASQQVCIDEGRSIATSQHVNVTCAFFVDACDNGVPTTFTISALGEVSSTSTSPTGAPILTTPVDGDISREGSPPTFGMTQDSTPTFSAESQAPSSVPPGFPEPKIVIPEINIKIPGLTNFVAPGPAPCPESLSKIGIASCKNFPWIGQYISALYNFGIAIAAFLAVVLVLWGGFLYITASGISSQAEKGKSFIQGAFLGLVIVFSSYILLATINPDLVKFHGLVVPDVPSVGSIPEVVGLPGVVDEGYEQRGEVEDEDVVAQGNAQEQPLDPFQGSGTLASSSSTSAAQSSTPQPRPVARKLDCTKEPLTDPCPSCPTLPSASFSANNVTYKGVKPQKDQPCQRRTDQVSPEMNTVMQKIIARLNEAGPASVIGAWQVTEAWPPTVPHDSRCHRKGCAVDLVLVGAATKERIDAMEKVLREFRQPGGLGCVLNEYRVRTNKRTGPHFHIELGQCR